MQTYRTLIAAALTAWLAGPAAAQAVKPIQDQSIDLGQVAGDVYYTARADGFHVVATFAPPGEAAAPVRFEAVLAPGQTVKLSTPRGINEPANAVEITRQNDRLLVRKAALVD